MRQEMSTRLKNHSGDLPIWAWLENPGNINVQERYGNDQIKITAQVPVSRCVFSDFDMWCCVINHGWLTPDIEKFEEWCDGKLKIPEQNIIDSWQQIFDFTYDPQAKFYNEYMGISPKGRLIQVCIDRIMQDDITNIKICQTL